ncbi:MAG: hypothetical protein GXY60_10550, partial [Spirochaetales bacterium]|nr:hypothetical protein [Spirochaetales bacterium]
VKAEEKEVWPKTIFLGVMVDFTVFSEIKKEAVGFEVSYTCNDYEKIIGNGSFTLSQSEYDQQDDLQVILFFKTKYEFKSAGTLFHCVKIFDARNKEIARIIAPNKILIKEHIG